MAVLKYKNASGEYVAIANYTVQPIVPLQGKGQSTTEVMSQKAVTDELNDRPTKDEAKTIVNNIVYGSDTPSTNEKVVTTDNLEETLKDYAKSSELENKQNKLTPGTGIEINDDTISCTLDPSVFEVVTSLPAANTAKTNKIYIDKSEVSTTDGNKYNEYVVVDGAWELIGTFNSGKINLDDYLTKGEASTTYATQASLSGYVTSGELTSLLSDKQNTLKQGSGITLNGDTISTSVDLSTLALKSYTVNTKRLDTNPTLGGADIELTGYAVSTLVNEALNPAPTDTVNEAIGKIHKAILDNEEVVSKALNTSNTSCGFNENGQYVPKHALVSTAKSLSSAIEILAAEANKLDYFNGHNTVTSISNLPINKRFVLATISANGSLSIESGKKIEDGKELHVIVYNSSAADVVVTIPTAAPFVNMSGDLTIKATSRADINILSDGTNYYVRAL